MGDAKEGFKKASSYSTIEPDSFIIQDDPSGPYYNTDRFDLPIRPELLANIVAFGVRVPVLLAEWEGKKYMFDGEQRARHWFEAIKEWKRLGEPIKPLPCFIGRVEPKTASLIGLSCNTHRLDLTPLQRIDKAIKLIAFGNSETDVCNAFGISTAQLKNWLKVDSLSAPVKKAIESGRIGVTAASKLSDLPATEQKEKLQEILDSGVKPTAEVAQRVSKGEKASEVKKVKKYSVVELRALLVEYANGKPTEDVRFEAILEWLEV